MKTNQNVDLPKLDMSVWVFIEGVYAYVSHDMRFPTMRYVQGCGNTSPTWSHFIQDKLKISIYLSLDKYKCIK